MDSAPLLTAEFISKCSSRDPEHIALIASALREILTGRVVCIDTATHVAVPKMTEAEARERFIRLDLHEGDPDPELVGYITALRDIGALVTNERDEQQRGQLSSADDCVGGSAMTFDEAKETIAFQQWKEKTWSSVGIMQGTMMHSAWLARAAQPVRVSREALEKAAFSSGLMLERLRGALESLNIEVTDK